ncbi:AraC family transcriptional regulator ligand-binding domain-containing protein [Nocardia xishanensis]|uniref:AraC family transcriptional regulator n=1 Tax=Nocardia xishanensis TaxID=238964 RepID=UPI0033F0D961
MALIRSAGIRGFRAAVAELGGNAERFAERAGLPMEALDSDDLFVCDSAMSLALELAAAELQCPDLALRMARRQDLGMLGPLSLAVQTSATLGEALECASAYLFVHSMGMNLAVGADPYGVPGVVGLRLELSVPGRWPVQGTDLTLGFIHRMTTAIAGGEYGLRSIELPYDPPAPLQNYEQFYGVPVHIRRPAAVARMTASYASAPIATSDEDVRRLALAILQRNATQPARTTSLVQSALVQSMGTANLDIKAVARLLALHPRTLQRRLADEGTTFATVLDSVRRSSARRLLLTTDMPMTQLAAMLGFAEQATLTKCTRRWWGSTPSAVRREGVVDATGES